MSSGPSQLDYAPSQPHRTRMRRAILLAVLGVSVLVGSKFLPVAGKHAAILYWQSRCLGCELPRPAVAWESGGAESPPLATPWGRFYAAWSPPGARSDRVVFLHELHSASGNRRLVAVTLSTFACESPYLEPEVIIPGSLWSMPRRASHALTGLRMPFDDPVCLYAGQPDPENPCHFTIGVRRKQPGQERIIDGWLNNDDTVLLELRRSVTRR